MYLIAGRLCLSAAEPFRSPPLGGSGYGIVAYLRRSFTLGVSTHGSAALGPNTRNPCESRSPCANVLGRTGASPHQRFCSPQPPRLRRQAHTLQNATAPK